MNSPSPVPPPLAQGRPVTWPDVWLAFVREIVPMCVIVGGMVVALKLVATDPSALSGPIAALLGSGAVASLGRSRPAAGAGPISLLVMLALPSLASALHLTTKGSP